MAKVTREQAKNALEARLPSGQPRAIDSDTLKAALGDLVDSMVFIGEIDSGANGGREVELRTSATHIQWRYAGDVTWIDLVAIESLVPPGQPGEPGREVQLQTNATHLQWRHVGDETWKDLIELSAIGGGGSAPAAEFSPGVYLKTSEDPEDKGAFLEQPPSGLLVDVMNEFKVSRSLSVSEDIPLVYGPEFDAYYIEAAGDFQVTAPVSFPDYRGMALLYVQQDLTGGRLITFGPGFEMFLSSDLTADATAGAITIYVIGRAGNGKSQLTKIGSVSG